MKRSAVVTAFWTVALLVGALWPGRVLSSLDGVPLDTRAEVVVIGAVLPLLWMLDRSFLHRPIARVAIVSLLVLKAGSALVLAQQGVCARFSSAEPMVGVISTIEINEPAGLLRSWDARADWRSPAPRCTAILDRSYRTQAEFPAAFLNQLIAINPRAASTVALDVSGFVRADGPGELAFDAGAGRRVRAGEFAAGAHPFHAHIDYAGEEWQLLPLWNGTDAWQAVQFTTTAPSAVDRMAVIIGWSISALVVVLAIAWAASVVLQFGIASVVVGWTAVLSILMLIAGLTGRYQRVAIVALLAAPMLAVPVRFRNARTVLMLIGVPWMALFIGHAWSGIGRFTMYSPGDDWQMFQAAAYSIFLNGDWIRGGSPTIYFQFLYRWLVGALHLVFGDSSVGQTFWDAGCLLAGALVPFATIKRFAGFRWAVAGAVLTLITFTVGPIWYLPGRGLAEIAALGWLALAALTLRRARSGGVVVAAFAGVFASLMFLSRFNHMLVLFFLPVFLLPVVVRSQAVELWRAAKNVSWRIVVAYFAVVGFGVGLLALHNRWYDGHFSLTYGTSFALQRTGLAPSTMFSPAVWAKIAESLAAQVFMREPAALDARGALVVIGALASMLAIAQVPAFRGLPATLTIMTFGTIAGSFIAHTHEYPGRMSVHVVPFAVAVTTCIFAVVLARVRVGRFGRPFRAAHRTGHRSIDAVSNLALSPGMRKRPEL